MADLSDSDDGEVFWGEKRYLVIQTGPGSQRSSSWRSRFQTTLESGSSGDGVPKDSPSGGGGRRQSKTPSLLEPV